MRDLAGMVELAAQAHYEANPNRQYSSWERLPDKVKVFHCEYMRVALLAVSVAVCPFDLVEMCDQCGNDTQLVFPSALPGASDFGEYQCTSCGYVQHVEGLERLVSP